MLFLQSTNVSFSYTSALLKGIGAGKYNIFLTESQLLMFKDIGHSGNIMYGHYLCCKYILTYKSNMDHKVMDVKSKLLFRPFLIIPNVRVHVCVLIP